MRRLLIVAAMLLPLAADAESIDWQDPQSVVHTAIEVSPALAALKNQIAAARERVIPAGSLPNPMLMGGVQNEPVNLSHDFMTMYMVGASQTLVRKSRREALRRSAELDVERLERAYEARRAEVERDVRLAYTDAAAAQNELTAVEEIRALLRSSVDAARARYEAGAVPQTDLIRAMLEESTLEHQLVALRRRRNAAVARLLPVLNLPANTPVPAFSLKHEMEHQHETGFEATLPESTPAIAELQAEVDRAEQDIRLAKLATKPDISVEASYGVRPRDIDMFSVTGRVELPIRKATLIEPRIREAVARREAAQQQVQTLRRQLRQDLGVAVTLRNEAIEQINLHVDKLVPEARLGFESAVGSYQTGKTTFDAVLGSLRTYLALNVDYYDFLKQQIQADIDIEAIRRGARSGAPAMAPASSMSSTSMR